MVASDPATRAYRITERDELVNITLTPDMERALTEQARKLGTTPEQLIIDSLREQLATTTDTPADAAGSLADLLQDHIGVLHSSEHVPGGARMSEGTGRTFAAGLAEQRRRHG